MLFRATMVAYIGLSVKNSYTVDTMNGTVYTTVQVLSELNEIIKKLGCT